MAIDDDWVSIYKAAELAGCSGQYLRRELLEHMDPKTGVSKGGRIEGWRVNGKAWLVLRASAVALRQTVSTRAKAHEAERKARQAAERPSRGRTAKAAKRAKSR